MRRSSREARWRMRALLICYLLLPPLFTGGCEGPLDGFFPQGPPAEPRVELFGEIRDSRTKSPIVGVSVRLREVVTSGSSQGQDLTTTSDDFGAYGFSEDLDFVHAGTFVIHASHPRYEDYISGAIEVKASVDVTEVSFEMKPIQ